MARVEKVNPYRRLLNRLYEPMRPDMELNNMEQSEELDNARDLTPEQETAYEKKKSKSRRRKAKSIHRNAERPKKDTGTSVESEEDQGSDPGSDKTTPEVEGEGDGSE